MSERKENIRKSSEETETANKKARQTSTKSMDSSKSTISTATSHPEINNLHIIDDAKKMMGELQIANIDNIIATSMAKHMEKWQSTITEMFAGHCSHLIESATEKVVEKVEKIEENMEDHGQRIAQLEAIADDFEQTKRNHNVIVRGLKQNPDPNYSFLKMVNEALGIRITENDIKFSAKIELKNEREGTDSMKVALFDCKLRDEIYSHRIKLKGTDIYISEDLTLKKSSLAYEARQYARQNRDVTTWTSDGMIILKDSLNSKPRVIRHIKDLKQTPQAPEQEKTTNRDF